MKPPQLDPETYFDLAPFGVASSAALYSFFLGRRKGRETELLLFTVTTSTDPQLQARLIECCTRRVGEIRSTYLPHPVTFGRSAAGESYCVGAVPAGTRPLEGAPVPSAHGYALHLARAVRAIHGANLVHRDLRPQALAITGAGRPLVFDCSYLARIEKDGAVDTIAKARGASAPSDAPESLRSARYAGIAADVFSFGVFCRDLGLPALPVLQQALDPAPEKRPASMDPILAALERAWPQSH